MSDAAQGENIAMTSKKKIAGELTAAFYGDAPLSDHLYAEVLEDYEDELKESLHEDADDALLCVLADGGEVAMMVIEQDGTICKNELALQKLKAMWLHGAEENFKKLIPLFAEELFTGNLAVAGIKWLPAQSI